MLGVLAGFFDVWCIILAGFLLGRRKILGENAWPWPRDTVLLTIIVAVRAMIGMASLLA